MGEPRGERLSPWAARPGETRGFPTPPRVLLTAAVGVGEAGVGGGEVAPTFLVAWGSGSAFPAPPKG